MNKELFAEYLRVQLAPTLQKGDIVVLDRSSVHTSKLVADTFEEYGIQYLFLPPYSPDFNPIELLWSKVKAILRKLKARTREKLDDAVVFALEAISLEDIASWFAHCHYPTDNS